jgi:hypothetical protein
MPDELARPAAKVVMLPPASGTFFRVESSAPRINIGPTSGGLSPMSARALSPEPRPEVLDANRLRVVLDLAERLRAYETKFGFATADLDAELASGRLAETGDVADWLIGYRTLTAVLGCGSAPAE